MITAGIVEIDLHNKNLYSAKTSIDAALKRSRGVYRIRVIHGFNNGTALRDMIWQDYKNAPKVIRLERMSEGVTDLILKEI